MKLKGLFGVISLAVALGAAVGFGTNKSREVNEVSAAVSKKVTRVYIEDQVTTTPVLAIESISFDESKGYGHEQWRQFLNNYLGSRSTYTTTSGSAMPSVKGWSYMSNSEQEKYLLCPTGSKNFTMIFPEWVTAFSYKAVGNNWWNWFDVNGSAVGVHSNWGIGKKINSYIYNDSGWKMNANLDNTDQTNTWGDVTVTAIAVSNGSEVARKSITVSKYYLLNDQNYNISGYVFGGWYTNIACTLARTEILTANSTIYAKQNLIQTVDLYVDAFDWGGLYIYNYEVVDGKEVDYYGSFPGTSVAISDNDLKFNGGKLQKVTIKYVSLSNSKFIFSDGNNDDSKKSGDMTPVAGAYYWHNGSAWTYDSSNYGVAAAFVYDLNVARLAVPASGSVKQYSICGLNAKTWVDRYDALNATARGYVDSASIYTYKDTSSSGADTRVTFAEVIAELRTRYSNSNSNSANIVARIGGEDSSTIIAVTTILLVSGCAAGGYFFLKRKKEN